MQAHSICSSSHPPAVLTAPRSQVLFPYDLPLSFPFLNLTSVIPTGLRVPLMPSLLFPPLPHSPPSSSTGKACSPCKPTWGLLFVQIVLLLLLCSLAVCPHHCCSAVPCRGLFYFRTMYLLKRLRSSALRGFRGHRFQHCQLWDSSRQPRAGRGGGAAPSRLWGLNQAVPPSAVGSWASSCIPLPFRSLSTLRHGLLEG